MKCLAAGHAFNSTLFGLFSVGGQDLSYSERLSNDRP